MMTIRFKVIPVWYDNNNNILYFDAITGQTIDTTDFKYLKEVDDEDFFSHKIDFNNSEIENSNSSLDIFVSEIKNATIQKKLMMGIPIAFNLEKEKIEKIRYQKLRKMEEKISEDNINSATTSYNYDSVRLLNVGQGLSVYDSANSFLMDVGGTIDYNSFKKQIEKKKYTVVISHWHYDHYKFLGKMIDDEMIKQIIFPTTIYLGKKGKELIKKIKDNNIPRKKMIIGEKIEVNGWKVQSPKERGKIEDLNLTSLMSYNNLWMLTGDQSYERFKNNMKDIINDGVNLQVPHHGSASSATSQPQIKWPELKHKISKAYVSCGQNNRYSHPSTKITSYFKGKILKVTE